MADGVRLTDVLTTASAVANFQGVRDVRAEHIQAAIEIILGERTLDDLGRPVSPLVSRVTTAGAGATTGVRELAQRWFERQGGDIAYELASDELQALRDEVAALVAEEGSSSG